MPTTRAILAILALMAAGTVLNACAPPVVETTAPYTGLKLAPPDRVIVSAFAASPPALRDALVVRLKARGMVAEAGDPDAAQGITLLVQGQSSTPTRPVMGLTAPGRTAAAEVQVLYVAGSAAPQFLESFGVEAADTQRLADVIAQRIATFAAGQAWIAGTKKGGS